MVVALILVLTPVLVPRPSLSLHSSQGVSLGDTVTLRCHLPRLAAWVWLYQEGGRTHNKYKDKELDAVEFSFGNTSWKHAGTYRCQYHVSEPLGTSEKSDPVELVLTDHSFRPPNILLRSEEPVVLGSNVTIWCWRQSYGGTICLHKDGRSVPIRCQHTNWAGMATFTLSGVTQADTGTYRCSYRPEGRHLLSSPLGEKVALEMTPTPAHPGAAGPPHGNLVVAVVRGCAAALVFFLGLFFVLDARSLWIQRDRSPGAEQVQWL
ncbi:leukocyte immunoglobulin-like receptor subfamily B member 1 [Gallus gallus]|uniref:leukocyte immunoglobulin-like receptor subfamily B member 1 n=1 Tax=Gallus gallus TaxID=9031 RepID=UPI001AE131F6|nr:leukocyte immunoglobulin-like receptor subfamily B member 1 [Gallus gallus]